MDRTKKLILTAAVVVGGVAMLVYSSMADAEFYKHVHEVMDEPQAWADKTLKVHGYVEAGSIQEEIADQKMKRTFILEYPRPDGPAARLAIHHTGPIPDTFKDLAEVVAKGRLEKRGEGYVLHATEIMAKCPSKYEENQRPSEYGRPVGDLDDFEKAPGGQSSYGGY